MIRLRTVPAVAGLLLGMAVLTGCGGMAGTEGPTREAAPFATALSAEYENLLTEAAADASARVRQTITAKRDAAQARERSLAESTSDWPISPGLATELAAGRAQLNRSLDNGGRNAFPEAAARAQVSYDCWLLAHADPALAPRRNDCEGAFRRSLRAVENAGIAGQPRGMADDVVFFGAASDRLTQAGQEAVAQISARRQEPSTRFVIAGSADPASESGGTALAERRAEAVRTALIGAGVPADRIETRGRAVLPPNLAGGGPAMGRRAEIWVL